MELPAADRVRLSKRVKAVEFTGQNPVNIARALRHEFEVPLGELQRLVGLEVARIQSAEQMRNYRRTGVELYEIVTADDDLVCAACRAAAASGPYRVGGKQKVPVKHCRSCRCTMVALG